MNTTSNTKKKDTSAPDGDIFLTRYADIFLKEKRVLFKCSLCHKRITVVVDDFPQLIDHLIYEHDGYPIISSPNLYSGSYRTKLLHCATFFFTSDFKAVFRCTNCAQEFKEFIPLIEHLLGEHYVELSEERTALSRLIPEDLKVTNEKENSRGQRSDLNRLVSEDSNKEVENYANDNYKRAVGNEEQSNVDPISNAAKKQGVSFVKEKDPPIKLKTTKLYEGVNRNFTESQDGSSYSCNFCGYSLPTRMEIIDHIKSHRTEKKYTCYICKKSYKKKGILIHHVNRHTTEKQFQCTECSFKFHTRTELYQHERRHRGERNFMCNECGKSYYTSGELTSHLRRHKDLRNFECDVCHKKFYDNFQLTSHKLLHTDERSHNCTQCDAKFKIRKTLVAHMKLHLNLKQYKCIICDARFNQGPGLHSHMKSVHRTKEL